ncbi:MAG: hypothetical protein ABH865_09105 [Candidatus Omnitrophota bacterium]|nr:hypothetical protein [Candidatus Omnitrophota bacterium]
MSLYELFFAGSLCVFLLLSHVPAARAQNPAEPALKFFVVNCDEKLTWIDSSGPSEGIIRKYWLDDGVFVVEYFVKADCSGVTFSGDYELRDSLLVLKRTVAQDQGSARCVCAHRLVYEFSGLPKRDYGIAIEAKR